MQLACNFSQPLMELLAGNPDITDCIKLSRVEVLKEEYKQAKTKPVLLHVLPNAGQNDLHALDWQLINRIRKKSKCPHLAIHLASLPVYWQGKIATPDEIKQTLIRGIRFCKNMCKTEIVIENVPYSGSNGAYKMVTDPAFIEEICEETDTNLLLDLAHLHVAAWNRGENEMAYLHALPLKRVKEIHVCGPALHPEDNIMKDLHLELQKADYQLLEKTLAYTNPAYITLEYGGTGPTLAWRTNKQALDRQLKTLRSLIQQKS